MKLLRCFGEAAIAAWCVSKSMRRLTFRCLNAIVPYAA